MRKLFLWFSSVVERHLSGLAPGSGSSVPYASFVIHRTMCSGVIASSSSCENSLSLAYVTPSLCSIRRRRLAWYSFDRALLFILLLLMCVVALVVVVVVVLVARSLVWGVRFALQPASSLVVKRPLNRRTMGCNPLRGLLPGVQPFLRTDPKKNHD